MNFYPRQFSQEGFAVFAPDPNGFLPSIEIGSGYVPDAAIASGKIPKGKTLVTCSFISPNDIEGPTLGPDDPPQSGVGGLVTGFTAVASTTGN
jgi:hypothetical protein